MMFGLFGKLHVWFDVLFDDVLYGGSSSSSSNNSSNSTLPERPARNHTKFDFTGQNLTSPRPMIEHLGWEAASGQDDTHVITDARSLVATWFSFNRTLGAPTNSNVLIGGVSIVPAPLWNKCLAC